MKAKNNYYVVWKGVKPGIYHSWKDCEMQVRGFESAIYKGFQDAESAARAFHAGPSAYVGKSSVQTVKPKQTTADYPDFECICVDAACSGNPGPMEYRGVHFPTGRELFRQGPFEMGTNNIGEFLAIVHGLALLQKNGLNLPVFSDSRNALLWVKGHKAKTKLEICKQNQVIFELISRAENWLNTNDFQNKLLKWETEDWGEIPADFGRK
jgi:ribonuclease HI